MATIDLSTAVGRIRAAIGDWVDPVILDDAAISQVYANSGSNENQAIRTCAFYILGTLSRNTRERVDRIEWYGSESFKNYLSYIEKVITNPSSGLPGMSIGGIYAGGISKEDFTTNTADGDIIQKEIPSYTNYREPDLDSLT